VKKLPEYGDDPGIKKMKGRGRGRGGEEEKKNRFN